MTDIDYRGVLEKIPAIVYIAAFGPPARNLYVSPQVEAFLGFSQAEWLADPMLWLRQIHPDDRARVVTEVQRPGRDAVSLEYRVLARDGRALWFHVESVLIRDQTGRPLFIQGVALDISDRKRAEEALARSEARYRRFLEEDLAGAYVMSTDGRILDCNPAFARMFRFASVEEAIGSDIRQLYPNPAQRESRRQAFVELLRKERRLTLYEAEFLRRDGTPLHVLANIVGGFDERGQLVETRGYFFDITERKQIEEALRKTRDQVKTLSGLLPICAWCNRIRDDKGAWSQIEVYIHEHSEVRLSHGICPDCLKSHYPEEYKKIGS